MSLIENNLSNSELKFLIRIENNLNRVYLPYILAFIVIGIAIGCFIVGLVKGFDNLYFPGMISFIFGISLFSITRGYHKMFNILSKMTMIIKKLEKNIQNID